MSFRCDKCGSPNHKAFDCQKPYNDWREREPALEARSEAKSAPETKPDGNKTIVEAVKPVKRDNLLPNHPDYDGQVPVRFRKNWPFILPKYRQEIDERIEANRVCCLASEPRHEVEEKPKREVVALTKSKKKPNAVREGLF